VSTQQGVPPSSELRDTVDPMTDGQKLIMALERIGKAQADLARAVGTSRGAAQKWVKAKKFGKQMWATIRPGLVKLGIDPVSVRADDPQSQPEDENGLWPEVCKTFRKEQLPLLRTILESSDLARRNLLRYVIGAVEFGNR
jgi:transcriptional regulator with XRE-family HTH domain